MFLDDVLGERARLGVDPRDVAARLPVTEGELFGLVAGNGEAFAFLGKIALYRLFQMYLQRVTDYARIRLGLGPHAVCLPEVPAGPRSEEVLDLVEWLVESAIPDLEDLQGRCRVRTPEQLQELIRVAEYHVALLSIPTASETLEELEELIRTFPSSLEDRLLDHKLLSTQRLASGAYGDFGPVVELWRYDGPNVAWCPSPIGVKAFMGAIRIGGSCINGLGTEADSTKRAEAV